MPRVSAERLPLGLISESEVRSFEADGYVVVRGLLEPRTVVEPLRRAYETLIDALITAYGGPRGSNDQVDGGERLATLLGVSGGAALDHLAPVLSVLSPRFRVRLDLPSAQLPELFALQRNTQLLDVVETLIGPEVYASPIYHLNTKLSPRHLALAEDIAARSGRGSPAHAASHYAFEVGRTPWHMDAIAGLRDSHDSRIIIAWVPLTAADRLRGCLLIAPRSHRGGVRNGPFSDDLTRTAVAVEANPGDVVLMDNKLVHAATENRSDEVRWACNLRYLPIGQPTGRPYLPGFVARSRSDPARELRDPYIWQAMWTAALANLRREIPLPNVVSTTRAQAEAITRRWRRAVPDDYAWLRLATHPTRHRLSAFARRSGMRLRRAVSDAIRS